MFVAHVNEVNAYRYGDLVATRTLAGIRSTAGKVISRSDWGRTLASVKAVVQPGEPGLRLELVLRVRQVWRGTKETSLGCFQDGVLEAVSLSRLPNVCCE